MADDGTTDEDERPRGRSEPAKSLLPPAVKSSLLWGAIGALVFLVLVQGYTLLVAAPPAIGFPTKLAVAVGVGGFGAALSYLLEGWLARSERS